MENKKEPTLPEKVWDSIWESNIIKRDRNIEIDKRITEANPIWKKFIDRARQESSINPNERSNIMINKMCEAMQ